MRIAFIEPHLLCVGGIRRIIECANNLVKGGHIVDIFTPQGRPCTWLPCVANIKNISTLTASSYNAAIFNLADQYEFMRKINAERKYFWVLAPEALYKPPTIPIKALQQGFRLLANSEYTVTYIHRYLPKAKNIPIINGGINTNHFKHDPSISKTASVIYYGSKRPWKGTALIEQSTAIFNRLGHKVLKLEGLNTPQHKMYTVYNSAVCCVTANLTEGFSFVQLEAMACGCAVVTTDDGGSRDYVRNGYNALVVPRDHSKIQEGLLRLLADTPLRKTLIKNGLNTAANPKFRWDNVTKQLEQAISK